MVCLCGNDYCDCKIKCSCNRELCYCSSCSQFRKKICKECGRDCTCLDTTTETYCNCEGKTFPAMNFQRHTDSDFLSLEESQCNGAQGYSGYNSQMNLFLSSSRVDSEAESEVSFDRSTSQFDELYFHTDESDSSPDENLEIKRLAEFSPYSRSTRSPIPSITVSFYGESDSESEYGKSFLPYSPFRRVSQQSSNMSLDSPPLHFAIESYESPPPTSRPVSAPAINSGSASVRRVTLRSPSRATSETPKISQFAKTSDEKTPTSLPSLSNPQSEISSYYESPLVSSRSLSAPSINSESGSVHSIAPKLPIRTRSETIRCTKIAGETTPTSHLLQSGNSRSSSVPSDNSPPSQPDSLDFSSQQQIASVKFSIPEKKCTENLRETFSVSASDGQNGN